MADGSPARLALLAVAVPLALLLLLDRALSLLAWLPPDDPLLFFTRTHETSIDPFVSAGENELEIRPDWVNDGLGLRGRRGKRAGRQFLLPGFRPVRVAEPKAAGTLRIFVVGGSTSYGLYVGAGDAFGAVLERRLDERAGGRDVEVVNLGCPGFASDRVLALLPRVLTLEPDLVVVLTGHNEMLVGPTGPVSALSPALALRVRLLRGSSLFAWWNHLLAGTLRSLETEQLREEVAALEAGQIPTYVPEEVPASARPVPGPEARRQAAERYARQVDAMLSLARDANVPMLIVVPAANLRAPAALSAHAGGSAPGRDFDVALRAGRSLLASGQAERALVKLDEAVALSPSHAEASYARADALRALGRIEAARVAYRLAVDHDVRTHRITSELERSLLQMLRARDADFVDLRPLLQDRLDDASRDALFVDHLHPTAEGHARIAEKLLPRAEELLGL
jgi:lysophospholipase L1-like esterase